MRTDRDRLIRMIAHLNDEGSLQDNPEYLRGQIELASDLLGYEEWQREDLERDIVSLVKDPAHEEAMRLAIECMFEEITIFGDRDEHSIKAAVVRKLTPEQLEWLASDDWRDDACFAEAVAEARLFYEDEAGGSHTIDASDDAPSWTVLAALPINH